MVLAVCKFRVYLNKPFSLITDHQAVRWLSGMNLHDEKGRKGRWVEFLQQFDMKLIHKAGRSPELSMADYLSRVSRSRNEDEVVCAMKQRPGRLGEGVEPDKRIGVQRLLTAQREHRAVRSDAEPRRGRDCQRESRGNGTCIHI